MCRFSYGDSNKFQRKYQPIGQNNAYDTAQGSMDYERVIMEHWSSGSNEYDPRSGNCSVAGSCVEYIQVG